MPQEIESPEYGCFHLEPVFIASGTGIKRPNNDKNKDLWLPRGWKQLLLKWGSEEEGSFQKSRS
jgi:hypothetical protein